MAKGRHMNVLLAKETNDILEKIESIDWQRVSQAIARALQATT